jgi:hypothetical protein
MTLRDVIATWLAASLWLFASACHAADSDPREAATVRIMEASAIDRLILADARAKAAADPKVEQGLDDLLYHVRPPALWNAQHPAWAPARAQLRELVGRESNTWIQQYWRESALKTHVRELAFSYRADFITAVRDFAESPAGQAYFGRRLAEARLKAGESMFSLDPQPQAALEKLAAEARRRFDALPAADKARVKAFAEDEGVWLDKYIARQSSWIAEVLLNHMGSIPYTSRDAWRTEIEARLAARLPVDSKKQLLGTLEMRGDATLVLRFTFHWKNAADGGKLALEVPKSHPAYAETLALAPGLAAGQSRVLYRDKDGLIGDKP